MSRTGRRNDFAFVCGVVSGGLYLLTVVIGGPIGLLCGCLSWVLLIWVGFRICGRLLPQSLVPRGLLCAQAIQPLALLGIILSGAQTQVVQTQVLGVNLAEHSGILCGSQMLGVFGVVLAGGLLWPFAGSATRRRGAAPLLRAIPNGSEKLLVAGVVLGSLRQLASLVLAGGYRYLFLVLAAPLELVALAAGRLSDEYRGWRRAALMVLVAGTVLGFLLGTRQAVVGLALYGIGRISTLKGRRLWRTLVGSGICAVPIFYLVGLVGTVRNVTGRDNIGMLSPGNISRFIDQAKDFSRSESDTAGDAIKTNSFGRIFAWATPVVIIMTPDPIPFLGLESLLGESLKYARISGADAEAGLWQLEENIGIARARDYGFLVNEANSIEFNLIADGWARRGSIGVVLVNVVACLALTMIEWTLSASRFLSRPSKLLLTCILLSVAIGTRAYPLLPVLRNSLLQPAAWAGVLLIAEQTRRKQSSCVGLPLRATSEQHQASIATVRDRAMHKELNGQAQKAGELRHLPPVL